MRVRAPVCAPARWAGGAPPLLPPPRTRAAPRVFLRQRLLQPAGVQLGVSRSLRRPVAAPRPVACRAEHAAAAEPAALGGRADTVANELLALFSDVRNAQTADGAYLDASSFRAALGRRLGARINHRAVRTALIATERLLQTVDVCVQARAQRRAHANTNPM
jgi:hypothetical protein